MILAMLLACGEPSEGVWVGNPTGGMEVVIADSPSFTDAQGSILFQELTLIPCLGEAVSFLETEVAIAQGRGRLEHVQPGTYCQLGARLDLTVSWDGAVPLRIHVEDVRLELEGQLVLGPDLDAVLRIGSDGWLEALAGIAPGGDGQIDESDAPGLDEAVGEAVEGGSSAEGEGTLEPPDPDAPPDPDPPSIGIPTSGVPCGPGTTIELAFPIPAPAMALGAGDDSGPGWCSGSVTFYTDPAPLAAGYYDYETSTVVPILYNGSPTQDGCGAAHCNDLTFGDGSVTERLCSLYALCEEGIAHSTGFTW